MSPDENRKISDCQIGNGKSKMTGRNHSDNKMDWVLAPNRYTLNGHTLAAKMKKCTGKLGPYRCFTGERNEKSLFGYLMPRENPGPMVNDFYNIPSEADTGNLPRNHYMYKFQIGPARQEFKDNHNPAPSHYFPKKIGCITKERPTKKSQSKRIDILFYPKTTVVINKRLQLNPFFRPDYGRYDPFWIKCLSIKDNFSSYNKHRQIDGNGHTSVFRSQTNRLIPHPNDAHILFKPRHSGLDNYEYFDRIQNVKRPSFSHLPASLTKVTKKPIRFNTTEPVKLRRKLKRKFLALAVNRRENLENTKKMETHEKQLKPNKNRPKKIEYFMPLPKPKIFTKDILRKDSIQNAHNPFSLEQFYAVAKTKSDSISETNSITILTSSSQLQPILEDESC